MSMAMGVGIVSLIYLLMNIVYLTNLPLQGVPGTEKFTNSF
jgi:hypothetical protein